MPAYYAGIFDGGLTIMVLYYYYVTGGGVDYTSGPYSVTFHAGVASVLFSISFNDDNTFEENENFTLTMNSSLPTSVMVGNLGQATVTIVDNDCKLCL